MTKTKMTFEKSLERLNEIIEILDSNTTSLEEMLELYEQGIVLAKNCKDKLEDAEQRVTQLIDKNGELGEIIPK